MNNALGLLRSGEMPNSGAVFRINDWCTSSSRRLAAYGAYRYDKIAIQWRS